MRLSVILLVTIILTLLVAINALSTTVHQRLKQNMALSDGVGAVGHKFWRVLKAVGEIDKSRDSEEERGLNRFPTLDQLKRLRKAERIKEIKEALTISKMNVKTAAEAAAKATKAKQVEAIAAQLDDAMVQKILKDPDVKDAVFKAWHQEKLHPQLVFDSFALPGKFTTAKWNGIGVAYLDFVTTMAKAAAGLS
ncbi:Putative RxLR effector [Phytophthora palmivora]|uniref:RxLR effector protein n=1 Tax=Phytophthora palmivora TaxID=4796 RepID=A0A2P4YSN7_9STRA|nr:Putative RxLR effector [Phytophthora palmivora]